MGAPGELQLTRPRDTVIVVPCFNEERRLDLRAIREFAATSERIALLFIDDGSRDRTAALLGSLSSELPDRVFFRRLPVNAGKAEAVRQGVMAAIEVHPRNVGYWDADLATPLGLIPDFLDLLDARPELLGVLGSRVRRLGATIERNPLRHYVGRVFATLASLTLGMAVYDTQCGAKIFRNSEALSGVFQDPFHSSWAFDVEVLARLRRESSPTPLADQLHELPLPRWADPGGSKMRLGSGAAAFLELLHIARKYR